jgi:hypothetical protein
VDLCIPTAAAAAAFHHLISSHYSHERKSRSFGRNLYLIRCYFLVQLEQISSLQEDCAEQPYKYNKKEFHYTPEDETSAVRVFDFSENLRVPGII